MTTQVDQADPKPAPRRLFSLLILFLGAAVGGGVVFFMLFDRTGRSAAKRVKAVLVSSKSTPPDNALAPYPWGKVDHENTTALDWDGVQAASSEVWKVRRGLDVELVAGGFEFPVNLVFDEEITGKDSSRKFYVTELHGKVKYVDDEGKVHTLAEGLNNFQPLPLIQGGKEKPYKRSDQIGLSGITRVPDSRDLIVTGVYQRPDTLFSNRILRLYVSEDGKSVDRTEVLLDLNELTRPSNHIQAARFGPDGKLYVAVGDGTNPMLSLDRSKFGGKILRMNLDGSACEDNPFFKPGPGKSPQNYIFAYGLRNVFDFDFQLPSERIFACDNGYGIDRFIQLARGASYGWDGLDDSIRTNSLYTWGPGSNVGPAGATFLRRDSLGRDTVTQLIIGMHGNPGDDGPNYGKSLWMFSLQDKTGMLSRRPEPIVQYVGPGKAAVCGVAEGPDGVYFTDFYGETLKGEPCARIWRVFPSEATLSSSSLAADDGPRLFRRNCAGCHRYQGFGGLEGPDLTDVKANLTGRLNSIAYGSRVDELLAKDDDLSKQQHDRLKEVKDAAEDQKLAIWLEHHLVEPRFDNPYARMPNFASALTADQRKTLIEYLVK